MDTSMKAWSPLVDRVVDDALLQTVSHVNQTLLQIDHVLTHSVLTFLNVGQN